MRWFWWVAMALLFVGCAQYVKTDVSVFHQLHAPLAGARYAIVPVAEQSESLEFRSYAKLLKTELEKQGMVETAQDQAEYLIYMAYGADGGQQVFSSRPVYGPTGWVGSFSTGTLVRRGDAYTGVVVRTPVYGIVGSETQSEVLFSRYLTIDMMAKADGTLHKVYEARALSIGETAMLVRVIPAMIRSVFEAFPGENGTTRSSRRALDEENSPRP